MGFKSISLLMLSLSSILAVAQSPEQIQTEDKLVAALCRAHENQPLRESLLKAHPQLLNSHLWSILTDRAVAEYYNSSPAQSIATYEIAIQVASQLQNPRLLGLTYYYLGRTYSGMNKLTDAIDAYEKSRRFYEKTESKRALINVLADLGLLYFIQDETQKARDYSERSLSLVETLGNSPARSVEPIELGQATALATLADIHLRNGDYDLALANLMRSLALYRQLSLTDPFYRTYVAGTLQTLGRFYTSSGDYRQALIHLNQALDIVKTLSEPNSLASLLNSIGVLYLEQEDYGQAKQQLDSSLTLYRSLKNDRDAARVLLNLAVVEQRRSNYEEALKLFRQSLDMAKSAANKDIMIAAGEGIGVVLTAQKHFPAALEVLNSSLAVARGASDKTRETEILWRTAQTYYESANYTESAALAENAVKLGRESRLPKLTYLAMTTLGDSYAAQGRIGLATQVLKSAVAELEQLRYQVAGAEVETQLFLENKVGSYHSLVELFIKQNKPVDALLFAERAKGRVLLDVMNGANYDGGEVLTVSERQEVQRLNRKISEINGLIKAQPTSSDLEPLYGQLDSARLDYQSFQNGLYVTHAKLRVRSGRTASLVEGDIDRLTVRSDAAYFEYVTIKERVYLFVLTPRSATGDAQLKVYPIAVSSEDLSRKVAQFHQRLANRHPDFAIVGRELYTLLIEPAAQQLRGITTICIVPDGFLWNLPFQALTSKNNTYLIEDHAVYYAPSLTVLRDMTKHQVAKEKGEVSLVAFGNPVIGKDERRNEELCPLPEAETEVTSVANALGSARSKVLIGREASEITFKALAPTYSTVHLATHGILDNRQPLYSHLLLTKTDGDVENDGLLEAREIMNMNLKADLAVLSACETANGRIAPGEGVMGMSWAFFVAGTRSMVVSQWKVNSASTSKLMMNFYHQRRANSKAIAIQKAAIQLMKDQGYRHPFYWAGFIFVGSNN